MGKDIGGNVLVPILLVELTNLLIVHKVTLTSAEPLIPPAAARRCSISLTSILSPVGIFYFFCLLSIMTLILSMVPLSLPSLVFFICSDYILHQPVAHNILFIELDLRNVVDPA